MAHGPGKYDKQLTTALNSVGALEGILIVIDGDSGQGFSAQFSVENTESVPKMLRHIADEIESS